ncbi:amidohydrolase family protein [Branchiibius sp. NY16-3462-2]|uniref:amidohydrolase family protein n=1 Tax=Branchiibius sp. NY16-3462-2 TaxID=1807500 RepID=UPI0007986AFA|nr:amidohydrolase family protein [Branchiibius sp. NY16-3462-2]KYH44156.1 amidohydrolase [Branchiibius sp. NY16-3462-2]
MSADPGLREAVEQLPLIDHHVHGALKDTPTRDQWANAFIEADTEPFPPQLDPLDTQLGFAVRAWCAPVLDLPRHVDPQIYWQRRTQLGEAEVNQRFLTAAGVERWLVDTGFATDTILDPEQLSRISGRPADEIVRLEVLAEQLHADGTSPADYPDAFRELLSSRTRHAVGTKTIIAYRCGFDVDLTRPSDAAVTRTYAQWHQADSRLTDPTLIAFGMHEATRAGLPLQIHVGFGDRDLDLRAADPLLLTDFLRDPQVQQTSVLLLHCYPYERAAGYLAQGFPNVYLDVGLAVNYLGARSAAVIARSLEMAPFSKILYSSDAYGPSELHYLGARLWRTGLTKALSQFVASDEWSVDDAVRITHLIGSGNARRAYPALSVEEQSV